MQYKTEKNIEQIEALADKLMKLARDTITVRFRFFDNAISRIKIEYRYGFGGVSSNGNIIYIDPAFLLKTYMDEQGVAVRIYMHVLLHLVFMHQLQYDKLDEAAWNMAADIAVENIIMEMDFPAAAMSRDIEEKDELVRISKRVEALTADKLYREFVVNGLSNDAQKTYRRLFTIDAHDGWRISEEQSVNELMITEDDWKKIARRIKTDLKTFSKDKGGSESLLSNVDDAVREKYNYREILQRFVETGEELRLNDDEFDYVYYTYGLSAYGNMPLIEPLEYSEDKRVKEIVIAIDTSASCRGDIVKNFVQKTYEMLKAEENFFRKINIHIIQCDAEIQSDIKIETEEDIKDFLEHGEIKGFGATDFRPVFNYVDALRENGEFEDLKGIIYFTDGYGIYPEHMPDYDVIFAFLNEDDMRQPVPGWAIKVIIEDSEIGETYAAETK
ncbi:MAG: VWA-like domain-containing protein [Coprococcus sp.]